MRPKEYIDKVRKREIYDPVLTFQISNDFHVRKVMTNYLPNDEESKHYATLLQWDNIYYQPTPEIVSTKTTVRVGLVQWQMRPYKGLDDVFEQVEFFVDAVSDYKSDFILFPEYFNAPLMAKFNHMSESEVIRERAKYPDEMLNRFINLAISYNINIITGSMPLIKDDGLYNVGFLCRRDGSYETYEKVHITPDEAKSWGLSGGKMVRTFETDQDWCPNLLRCRISGIVAYHGGPGNADPVCTLLDRYAKRLFACPCLRAGTCDRKRMFCRHSR